ncbi:pentapeptide repeat-containing protein [Paenibacillus sp. HN-1]|uniref:pentapeptide repeat-containing protein n=1 Tax=Paenibacillus TaxID=44249 RepID=UPI001CA912F0|nr:MULTISPECIES: pentapeptide repeat-containing protein [Paenibacillus]MBY9078640.1 pentapeptide repeat-containing protein [Paenibacillus sp. CGMCC 1.18879]MBY9084176.1 pentapeptide repeat-containing protein [Paenibacillus sinensis]
MTELNAAVKSEWTADCASCFGLCCVALPFARSADFAFDKAGGDPCLNLNNDFRCGVHAGLRAKGMKGCTVYDCFGAGQQVSQHTFAGEDWRAQPELRERMFRVFPVMQQLHEMLYYLDDALQADAAGPVHQGLREMLEKTVRLTGKSAEEVQGLDVQSHRSEVNEWLLKAGALVRAQAPAKRGGRNAGHRTPKGMDWIGAHLRGADLPGVNLRGRLLIAADLRNADLRYAEWIGADLRDADLSGADLTGGIYLTQAQLNAAQGSRSTKLPSRLDMPAHWLEPHTRA